MEDINEKDANQLGYIHGGRNTPYKNPFEVGSANFNEYERGYWQAFKIYAPTKERQPFISYNYADSTYRERAILKPLKQDTNVEQSNINKYKLAKDGG